MINMIIDGHGAERMKIFVERHLKRRIYGPLNFDRRLFDGNLGRSWREMTNLVKQTNNVAEQYCCQIVFKSGWFIRTRGN
jgi:hypothetical protein